MNLNWRFMQQDDLPQVIALAERVHRLYECDEVYAERLAIYPQGCLVLASDTRIEGYALSHPITAHEPPALNSLLLTLPRNSDNYYLHDLVVAPNFRSSGHASAGVRKILELAKQFRTTSLIAVYGTTDFWSRFGFAPTTQPGNMQLASYGDDVVYMVRPCQ